MPSQVENMHDALADCLIPECLRDGHALGKRSYTTVLRLHGLFELVCVDL